MDDYRNLLTVKFCADPSGHLIECDKNQKLCDIFRVDCAIRWDYYAVNYAIFYIVLPGFKGEKPL